MRQGFPGFGDLLDLSGDELVDVRARFRDLLEVGFESAGQDVATLVDVEAFALEGFYSFGRNANDFSVRAGVADSDADDNAFLEEEGVADVSGIVRTPGEESEA